MFLGTPTPLSGKSRRKSATSSVGCGLTIAASSVGERPYSTQNPTVPQTQKGKVALFAHKNWFPPLYKPNRSAKIEKREKTLAFAWVYLRTEPK